MTAAAEPGRKELPSAGNGLPAWAATAPAWAVIVAGGVGRRLGAERPKQFISLLGRPVLAWSVATFAALPDVAGIVVVLPESWIPDGRRALAGVAARQPIRIVAGGARRQDSVRAGVTAIPEAEVWVAVHDAARPLIPLDVVTQALATARVDGNAVVALESVDTLVEARDGFMVGGLDRSRVFRVQTPQVFPRPVLLEALAAAERDGVSGTDDAGLVRRLGYRIRLTPGSQLAHKVTVADDLAMLAALHRRDDVQGDE